MAESRCIHGIDSRFCAVCNRRSASGAPRQAIGSVTLPEIMAFLDADDARATRRAVADALGLAPKALSAAGSPRIVDAAADDVIATGTALLMRMTAWQTARRT